MLNTDIGVTLQDKLRTVQTFSSEEVENRLEKIEEKLKDLPAILDKDTLMKLRDGEYEITLKEYSDMSTYRTKMNAIYGNFSASQLHPNLNKVLGKTDYSELTSKEFIEQLKEQGVDKESAMKLCQTIKSYSLLNTFTKSYVSAVV